MAKLSIIVFTVLVLLSIIIKNIYLFIIAITGFTIYLIYVYITCVTNRKVYKVEVSEKINLYCKSRLEDSFSFTYISAIVPIVNFDIDFKYIIGNFFTAPFMDQFEFIYIINAILWLVMFISIERYIKIDSKQGILYKEGLILENGRLYRFSNVKSYEFKTSFKGIKYRELVLTFDDNKVKTVYIYKDDIEKFKELLK